MEFFVGLDVSLDETHICVVDEGGRIIEEARAPNEPRAIAKAIRRQGRRIEHVGLEPGNLSPWLHEGLVREGFSVSVMEARHVRAAFAAMRVKTAMTPAASPNSCALAGSSAFMRSRSTRRRPALCSPRARSSSKKRRRRRTRSAPRSGTSG